MIYKKKNQHELVEKDKEEKRMWDVFKFIENNVQDILIPNIEVISHIKPSKGLLKKDQGFINFLWKYPVFPKRNKEELQFSKEALNWYEEFYELLLLEVCYIDVFTGPLGGITFEDQKKWRYKKSLGSVHRLKDSEYFNDVYSFYEESIYCFDGWYEDSDYDFTDDGIDFEWSYPPYFTIFDDGLKNFSQRLWRHFLQTRVEMTLDKEELTNDQ